MILCRFKERKCFDWYKNKKVSVTAKAEDKLAVMVEVHMFIHGYSLY